MRMQVCALFVVLARNRSVSPHLQTGAKLDFPCSSQHVARIANRHGPNVGPNVR
jgi:hypothetical protein